MKIKFKNLAHISSGEFENTKLTILMGDNGSGKTLLLETFSYIAELYNDHLKEIVERVVKENLSQITIEFDIELFEEILSEFYSNDFERDNSFFLRDIDYNVKFSEPEYIANKLIMEFESLIPDFSEKINKRILNNDSKDFTFTLSNLPRITNKIEKAKLNIYIRKNERLYISETKGILEVDFTRFLKEDYFKMFNNSLLEKDDIELGMIDLYQVIESYSYEIIVDFIYKKYYEYFLKGEVTYFPSERNSDYLDLLWKNIGPEKFEQFVRYSEQNYHEFLSEQRALKRHITLMKQLKPEIIKLIGGIPNYNTDGEIVSLKMGEFNLDKKMFSTKIIRTLPYIHIGLHLTRVRTLIVEEPEAHLSLKSMDSLINVLRDVNIYRDILVTTHSDVFYQKLINMISSMDLVYAKNVKVYELLSDGISMRLKECERNEYGFAVEFFKDALEKHYLDTLKIQESQIND